MWLTPDPIGVLGGLNLYRYVNNNPSNWVDILGLHLGDYQNGPGENDEIGDSGNGSENEKSRYYSDLYFGGPGTTPSPFTITARVKVVKLNWLTDPRVSPSVNPIVGIGNALAFGVCLAPAYFDIAAFATVEGVVIQSMKIGSAPARVFIVVMTDALSGTNTVANALEAIKVCVEE